jgi:hypothetical protein
MDFYGEVLRELVTALGAALFIANALALARRRSDKRSAARKTVARARPGSPVRGQKRNAKVDGDLAQAPVARSVTYMLIGLVVMIWGLATIITG